MFSLDERVDCAWLQSGLTGHRGTDRMEGRGGRKATVQNLMRGAVKTRGSSKTHLSQFSLQTILCMLITIDCTFYMANSLQIWVMVILPNICTVNIRHVE